MTMRNPQGEGLDQIKTLSLDPRKRYRYTWPGQKSAVVSGEELEAICKGADASMLDIHEVGNVDVGHLQKASDGKAGGEKRD